MNQPTFPILASLALSCALAMPGTGSAASDEPAAQSKPAPAASRPRAEIKVSLFSQPCLLQGPLDESSLASIHAISPEQTYAVLSMEDVRKDSVQQLKGNLEKLRKAQPLPQALERYRDRLARRLEAQIAFLEGLQAAQAQKSSAPLIAVVKKHLQGKVTKPFESAATKLDRPGGAADPAVAERLYEIYGDLIEADPEEEFHRGIQKLNVQYVCAFDEQERDGEPAAPEPPAKR
ncbi:MAG: hypothetical protein NDJ89_01860 [Oligoflexia bacterium]|nr:hypothetical protein [Oligoflexia bacterium]